MPTGLRAIRLLSAYTIIVCVIYSILTESCDRPYAENENAAMDTLMHVSRVSVKTSNGSLLRKPALRQNPYQTCGGVQTFLCVTEVVVYADKGDSIPKTLLVLKAREKLRVLIPDTNWYCILPNK